MTARSHSCAFDAPDDSDSSPSQSAFDDPRSLLQSFASPIALLPTSPISPWTSLAPDPLPESLPALREPVVSRQGFGAKGTFALPRCPSLGLHQHVMEIRPESLSRAHSVPLRADIQDTSHILTRPGNS